MTNPKIWNLKQLCDYCAGEGPRVCISGQWVPARPHGWPGFFYRVKAALLVFTGRADAVVWLENSND